MHTYNDKKYTWNELFKNEEELIQALSEIDEKRYEALTARGFVKGSDYITTMVRTVRAGKQLSDAQIRQLKRLAKYIKIYQETKHIR